MQIEISSDLLQSSTSKLSLVGLLAHGFSERHVVLVDPTEEGASDAYNAWIAKLADRKLREELKWVLSEGDRRASAAARRRLKVSSTPGSKSSVPLEEALLLCGYPYRVLLENGRTDRNFLLAAAGPHRTAFAASLKRGWLLLETGGGIGEVKKRLDELREQVRARERFYCLVDSDARDGTSHSDAASFVQSSINDIAAAIDVTPTMIGKVLERRAVENYVDIRAFQSWLKSRLSPGAVCEILAIWSQANEGGWDTLNDDQRGQRGTDRRALIAALALEHAPENVWYFFDLSQGRGKIDNLRTTDTVWNELSPLQQSALEHGIQKRWFHEFYESSRAKTSPSSDTELQEVVRLIQERQ